MTRDKFGGVAYLFGNCDLHPVPRCSSNFLALYTLGELAIWLAAEAIIQFWELGRVQTRLIV